MTSKFKSFVTTSITYDEHIFTARKRSLRRLCFHKCLSVHRGGVCVVSQHTLQVVSQHALQVSRGGSVYPSMPCRFPGPHPKGSLWGLAGGGGLQAHTCRGSPGPHPGGSPGPYPGGRGGVSQHALRQTPPAGGTHLTGIHSCCELSLLVTSGTQCNFWDYT